MHIVISEYTDKSKAFLIKINGL